MLQNFYYQDTSPKQEKSTPLGLVIVATEAAEPSCPFEKCSADLIQTTIFFCLISCKYTKNNSHRRTVQFRFKDMQLQDKEGVIPQDAPTEVYLQAQTVNLFLDTQKNSTRGEFTTAEATSLKNGNPVSAAAWHFFYFRQHIADPGTTICSNFPATGTFPKRVTITNIVSLLRLHSANLGFQCLGFYPCNIESHLLCLGGAMTLHQVHIPDSNIKIIRIWRSYAFLIYLQGQVATYTKGVATTMAKIAWFHQQVAPACTPAEI